VLRRYVPAEILDAHFHPTVGAGGSGHPARLGGWGGGGSAWCAFRGQWSSSGGLAATSSSGAPCRFAGGHAQYAGHRFFKLPPMCRAQVCGPLVSIESHDDRGNVLVTAAHVTHHDLAHHLGHSTPPHEWISWIGFTVRPIVGAIKQMRSGRAALAAWRWRPVTGLEALAKSVETHQFRRLVLTPVPIRFPSNSN
jgi:hypothetical protein